MKRVYSAGIVPFYTQDNEPQYLLLHYTAGHWDFPKGHLEQGETNEQAAVRELREETGLTAAVLPSFKEELSYWLTDRQTGGRVYKTVTFFTGTADKKEVNISFEHQGFMWLPYEQALKQLTYANAKKLLEKVHAFVTKHHL